MGAKGRHKGAKRDHYQSPGVYVEEVPAASKPIEGVGTSVAAFVGLSPLRPGRLALTVALLTAVAMVARKVR